LWSKRAPGIQRFDARTGAIFQSFACDTSWHVAHTRTSKSSAVTFRRLAARHAQRVLALAFRGGARAAQQPFARNAERLLETVARALESEVGVELVDHRRHRGRVAVRHLARHDRRLDVQAMAFLALLLEADRLHEAAAGIRLVAARAFEHHASLPRRLHALPVQVHGVRKFQPMPAGRKREAELGMRLREVRDVARLRIAGLRVDVAMACDAHAVIVAMGGLGALVLPVAARAARALEERGRMHRRRDVLADLLVALQACAVLHLLESDLVACGAFRGDGLVAEHERPRVPETVADPERHRGLAPRQVEHAPRRHQEEEDRDHEDRDPGGAALGHADGAQRGPGDTAREVRRDIRVARLLDRHRAVVALGRGIASSR
jgi:hypothetical protein